MGDQFNTHPQPRTFAPSKEGEPLSNSNVEPQTDSRSLNVHACAAHRCPSEPAILLRRARVAGEVSSRTQTTRPHALTPTLSAGSRTIRSTTQSPTTSQTRTSGRIPRVRRSRHPLPVPCRSRFVPLLSVRDTLNNLILKSPQSWRERRPLEPASPASAHLSTLLVRAATSVGLPFFQIQGTVVEWDEVRFGELRTSTLRPSSAILTAPSARVQMFASCSGCPMRASAACKPRCAGATAIAWSAG